MTLADEAVEAMKQLGRFDSKSKVIADRADLHNQQ